MDVRRATASDIDAVVAIIELQRREYHKYQPMFWHKVPNAAALTREQFAQLLAASDTHFLVATEGRQLLGFLVARKFSPPQVHDPGGETYLINDFCVLEPRYWLTIGEALLSYVSTLIHEHGGTQIIVTCAERDLAKSEMLRRSDLTVASSWWTKPLR